MKFPLGVIVVSVFIAWVKGEDSATPSSASSKVLKLRPLANGTKWIESLLETMAKYEDLSTYFDSTSMCYKSIFGTKKADTKDPKFVLNAALLLKCVVVTDLLAFPYSFYRGLSKKMTDISRQMTWTNIAQQMAMLPVIAIRQAIEQPGMTLARLYVIILSCVIAELLVLAERSEN